MLGLFTTAQNATQILLETRIFAVDRSRKYRCRSRSVTAGGRTNRCCYVASLERVAPTKSALASAGRPCSPKHGAVIRCVLGRASLCTARAHAVDRVVDRLIHRLVGWTLVSTRSCPCVPQGDALCAVGSGKLARPSWLIPTPPQLVHRLLTAAHRHVHRLIDTVTHRLVRKTVRSSGAQSRQQSLENIKIGKIDDHLSPALGPHLEHDRRRQLVRQLFFQAHDIPRLFFYARLRC